jgi:hypothetical protein
MEFLLGLDVRAPVTLGTAFFMCDLRALS